MDRRTFVLGMFIAGSASFVARADRRLPATGTPLSEEELRHMIAAMKPPKRQRPLVAIVADNRGAETTDLLVPYGVLSHSALCDVIVVAPQASEIHMMPALRIKPQATLTAFDEAHPSGPDYVIVPAFHHDDGGPALDWIRAKAAQGATVIGVCSGAKVLGHAGLLNGRRATTHWFDIKKLQRDNPTMIWVRDRRYVVDRGIVTTTGVMASIPMSLALVEAIGGKDQAQALANDLGASSYDPGHDSNAYKLTMNWIETAIANSIAFWSHETVGIPVADGVDEISLALTADAYSRTYRSQARTLAPQSSIRTRFGLTLLVDDPGSQSAPDLVIERPDNNLPARSLDIALARISQRYGKNTAAFVALQMEYPWYSNKTKI